MIDSKASPVPTRGRYFEEFEIGEEIASQGRTITETDVVAFAALSGDYNPLHTDAEFAKSTPFGQRIAHGLLVLSIASGLVGRLGVVDGTVLAFRELEWKFSRPVLFGDTVHVRLRITESKAMARLGGGLVIFELAVINQRDEIAQRGTWQVLVKSRP